MAANTEWVTGDELDILDQLLFDDDLFDEEIKSSIKEMPTKKKLFPCEVCPKVCLSSGGLKRHISAKHNKEDVVIDSPDVVVDSPDAACGSSSSSKQKKRKVEDILHPGFLKKMVNNSLEKVKVDKCYPPPVLIQLSCFNITSIEDIFPCYHAVTNSILKFKGDLEKFYPEFYSAISSNNVFPGLDKNCQLILGFELANHVVAFLSGGKLEESLVSFDKKNVTEKEEAVISNFTVNYVLLKKTMMYTMNSFYQFLSHTNILKGLKLIQHIKLNDAKDRGGL